MALSLSSGSTRAFIGSIRLFLIRFGLVLLMSLPALLTSLAGVAEGPAKAPYYTEPPGKLPFVHLTRLVRDLPSAFLGGLALAIVFAVLLDQLLLAAAVQLADPARPAERKVRVLSVVAKEGLVHLWPFLRAIGWSFGLIALGSGLIRALYKKLSHQGELAGWTGKTMVLMLPLLAAVLFLVWFAGVSAWLFWTRLISAADARRKVRRTGVVALKVFWRRPLRSWGLFVLLSTFSIVLSGAVLFSWRFSEPRGISTLLWAMGFLMTAALQAAVWVYLVRAGMLLYSSDICSDLRTVPDESFRLWGRLWGLFRSKKQSGAAQASPAGAAPEAETPDAGKTGDSETSQEPDEDSPAEEAKEKE